MDALSAPRRFGAGGSASWVCGRDDGGGSTRSHHAIEPRSTVTRLSGWAATVRRVAARPRQKAAPARRFVPDGIAVRRWLLALKRARGEGKRGRRMKVAITAEA